MNEAMVILHAEDDDGHALLIEKNLRRLGTINRIIRFMDGQELLDFLSRDTSTAKSEIATENHTPYLVLLDIRMPKVDGVEVLRIIKENSDLSNIPVIVLTTTGNQETITKCDTIGCEKYIIKPVSFGEFGKMTEDLQQIINAIETPELLKGEE